MPDNNKKADKEKAELMKSALFTSKAMVSNLKKEQAQLRETSKTKPPARPGSGPMAFHNKTMEGLVITFVAFCLYWAASPLPFPYVTPKDFDFAYYKAVRFVLAISVGLH